MMLAILTLAGVVAGSALAFAQMGVNHTRLMIHYSERGIGSYEDDVRAHRKAILQRRTAVATIIALMIVTVAVLP